MDLTMALTPRIFERNGPLSLLGAGWAASPWAALSYRLFTTPLNIAGMADQAAGRFPFLGGQ